VAVPVIELADDLVTKLGTETGETFERRVTAYFSRDDVSAGKWVVIPAGDETEIKGRMVDSSTLTVDVGYQEALPEKTSSERDPLNNKTWFDARMQKLEDVKDLFRGEGSLRRVAFAPSSEFRFQRMSNTPIYRPDLMTDYQIFTAVVRLEFLGEIE
jgi:hypothetical protein